MFSGRGRPEKRALSEAFSGPPRWCFRARKWHPGEGVFERSFVSSLSRQSARFGRILVPEGGDSQALFFPQEGVALTTPLVGIVPQGKMGARRQRWVLIRLRTRPSQGVIEARPQTAGHTCSGDLRASWKGLFRPEKATRQGGIPARTGAVGRRTRRGTLASGLCVNGMAGGAGSGGCRRGFCGRFLTRLVARGNAWAHLLRGFPMMRWCVGQSVEEGVGWTQTCGQNRPDSPAVGASVNGLVSAVIGHKLVAEEGAFPPIPVRDSGVGSGRFVIRESVDERLEWASTDDQDRRDCPTV